MVFRRQSLFLWLLMAAIGLWVYFPSLWGGFVYDDLPAIADNPSIRRLWPPWQAAWAERENPLAGRPVPNLSMAVHYALHGLDPLGYHLGNVALHVVCAMLFYAIVRRTLLHEDPRTRNVWLVRYQLAPPSGDADVLQRRAGLLAAIIAILWLVHPINSETVAYMTQRTELCVSLFLLLTLYGVIRAAQSETPVSWRVLAVLACALGMLSKEVMVGAPLLVLFYERCFLRTSWKQTLGYSRGMYAGLAATWIILALIIASGPRSVTVGFDRGILVWDYMKAQAISLAWYLWLCFWPQGLRLAYWWGMAPSWREAAPAGILVLVLLGGSIYGLVRGRGYGFLGAWCFVILGPSSSFVPIVTEITADRRMYLPSAAIITLLVLGAVRVLETWRPPLPMFLRRHVPLSVVLLVVVILGLATWRRAGLFGNPIELWYDNVRLEPTNPYALNNLAVALMDQGRMVEASWYFRESLRYRPLHTAYSGLGGVLAAMKQHEAAVSALEQSLRLKPNHAIAWSRWGLILLEEGKPEQAMEKFLQAVEHEPHRADFHANLGLAYFQLHRHQDALVSLRKAVELDPRSARAYALLGMNHRQLGQLGQAREHLLQAVRLDPADHLVLVELGLVLAELGDLSGAVAWYEKAVAAAPQDFAARFNLASGYLRLRKAQQAAELFQVCVREDPEHVPSRLGLAKAMGELGDADAAEKQLLAVLERQPHHPGAMSLLGDLYAATGRLPQAVAFYQQLVEAQPRAADNHNRLGIALAQAGRLEEAVAAFAQAVEIAPDHRDYRDNLEHARSMLTP